jgi:dTDP-4-dehydrorhamnose 3,5-epimerase
MLFVPRGFAHGYVTLTDDAEVLYRVDAPYHREAEGGLAWNDPTVAIPWPVAAPELNDRDRAWPGLEKV